MGFEHLHRHSDFSLLDGFARVSEYAEYQKEINQKFLCITDHGVMGAIPQQVAEAEKHNLFPLFGVEFYVNPMQPKLNSRAESAEFRKNLGDELLQKKFDKSHHLLAIAYNDVGYSNLVRLTSWAWIHGFYRRPRINHEILMQHKEGIVFTSTCGNSEIANAFMGGRIVDEERTTNPDKPKYKVVYDEDAGMAMVEKYMAMFGEHFYLELMMLDWVQQRPYNEFLIRAHDKYHIPLILSQDCFVAGTLVLTDFGFKKIEDIVIGDRVLTHKNRWRSVEVTGSRPVRADETVYRVSTEAGTFAYEATGNHEVYVSFVEDNQWRFDWVRTENLISGQHHLTLPKIQQHDIFSDKDLDELDLMDFIDSSQYQFGTDYKSSNKGNMGCCLQFNEETQEFVSYRGWNRANKTVVPRKFKINEDFLKVLGWFIAEGWAEKKSNQVGFALHSDEQHVADMLIKYFDQFGIKSKIYKVSENGIAIRFSSVVFNRIFGKMCGFGANNKHLPMPDGKSWMKNWSRKQISVILREYWKGDGSNGPLNNGLIFASTSKRLIYEISCVFNACGVVSLPCEEKAKKETWSNKFYVSYSGTRGDQVVEFLLNGECNSFCHRDVIDLGEYYVVPVRSVVALPQEERTVYCFQVEEDHSFTAGLYAVSNCHYCRKEHSQNQRLMLMQQNKRTLAEVEAMIANGEADDIFELQDTNLWLKSEDELNSMWEFNFQSSIDYELFKQAKANTVKIAEFAKNVQIDRGIKLPKIPDADTVLWEEILKGFKQRGCPKTPTYIKRIREEYDLITEKGFASYFIIQKMMVDEARRKSPEIMGFGDGSEAVGPGRGCLHPLTPIRLENGIVRPIREVKIGDRVYTIDGTLREVQKIMTYPLNNEPLLRINTFYGDCFGVPLTLDHKVYAERKLDSKELKIYGNNFQEPKGNCDWVEARNLNVGDWCFVPTPLVKEIEDFECDLSQFSDANFFTDHKFTFDDNFVYQKSSLKENAIEIQRHWKLTPEWAYLLGVFANDGWTCEKQFGKVYFSSDSRQNHLDHVFEMIQRCGLNSSLVEREYGEDSHQLIINSSCIQMLFEFLHPNYFYSSQTKCVPDCILKGPLNIVESYISGCFKNNNHKIETTSQVLAEQIRFLLLRLGLPSSLLSKTKKDCSNLGVLYTIDRPVGYHINGSVENGWKRVPNGIMLRIREISEIRDVDHVCDIQIEGNHNYLTSSFLVHNSVCGSLVAYCLRLHDVEPIIHDLRFSRFLSPARGGKQQKFRHTIQPLPHQEFPLD